MHDRNGTPLKVGDKVMIPGTITNVQTYENFCNATVDILPMRGAGDRRECWTGNTGQVVLIEKSAE